MQEEEISVSLKPQWKINTAPLELPVFGGRRREEGGNSRRRKSPPFKHFRKNLSPKNGEEKSHGSLEKKGREQKKPLTSREYTRKMSFQKGSAGSRSWGSLETEQHSKYRSGAKTLPQISESPEFTSSGFEDKSEQKEVKKEEERKEEVKKDVPVVNVMLGGCHSLSSSSSNSSETSSNTSPRSFKKSRSLTKHTSSPQFRQVISHLPPKPKLPPVLETSFGKKKHLSHVASLKSPKITRAGSDSALQSTFPNLLLVGPHQPAPKPKSTPLTGEEERKKEVMKSRESFFNELHQSIASITSLSPTSKFSNEEERFLRALGWSPMANDDDYEWSLTEEEISDVKDSLRREDVLKIRQQLKSKFEDSMKDWVKKNKSNF